MSSAPVVVKCRVVSSDGAPIAGASVYVIRSPVPVPDIAQLTDAEGNCVMTVPVPGPYRFGARTSEGHAGERDVAVNASVVALDILVRRS